ncbi:MAG TPA: branched-chain amino acid ABC transporter permease [Xanthobacteraceae bacterium]|nr:branched-chain amino acid ABC transporter permease [Xanthobacteraceae bacterium]
MRPIFKTDYDQDIRLLKHRGYWFSYGALLLAVMLLPFLVGPYLQSQIVFVFIYSIVGVGLLILAGFTGQVSLGHAAFLAIGAYTTGYMQRLGVPFVIYLPLAVLLSGAVGALVGTPALRLSGIYLVIATIAFGFIAEEVAARWESVTNGNEGLRIKALDLFGFTVTRDGAGFYYLCFALLIAVMLSALNLLRSPTGRAFVAIRDSETAAKSLGINLAVYKVMAFSISAGITGLAGCLYAHKLSFISPEMFTLLLSLEFIIVIIIGGIGSLHGAVLGSIFVVMVDPCLTLLKDDFPPLVAGLARQLGASAGAASSLEETLARLGGAAGLKGAIYGIIIVLFIIFEPYGLYGRWLKMQHYFQLFPLYKKATFRRQKTYVKSERNR